MKYLQQTLAILLGLLLILFLSIFHVHGQSVQIKRLEGSGNMARTLNFVSGSHDSLFISDQNRIYHPVYDFDQGPVRVEVLDPSLVPAFQIRLELNGVDYQCLDTVVNQTHPLYSFNSINLGTGIADEFNSASDILIYPNPASESVYIKCPETGQILGLEMFDLSGKLVLRSSVIKSNGSSQMVDIRGLDQGLYFVIVETDLGIVSKKLLVN